MVDEDIKRAADYAAQIVWRLETLQYRSRFNEQTGETTRLPTKIRRFANGLPRDLALPVLHVIANGSPYTGKNLFNGEGSDDEFVSTGVYIRKDQTLDAGSRKDATYTIVQDLRLRDSTDELSVGDSVSCSRESYSDYRWDEVTAGLPPDAVPEQGVVWQVTDVRREADTELFSYHIRKSVAVTQHTDPVVTQCDKRRTVTTEIWDNVYGGPDTGYECDSVRNGGAPIAIPECSESAGETVSVRVSQNEDCTYQIIIERAISRQGFESEYLRYKDRFRIEASDTVDGQSEGLSKSGVEVSGGVMMRYESHQNDDGTWRNTVTMTMERQVQESDRQVTVTPRYTATKWTDTSVGAPADAGILNGYYGSYKSTKTPGGLFTNEYVTYAPSTGAAAEAGEVTVFARTRSTEDVIQDFEDGVLEPGSFMAGGGVTRQRTYTKDDTTGLVTRRVATTTEQHVARSSVTVAKSLRSVVTKTTEANKTDDNMDPPETGSLGIGTTVEKTLNPGGSVTVTTTTKSPNTDIGAIRRLCANTATEHTDTAETVIDGGMPSDSHLLDNVASPVDGKYAQTEYTLDDDNVVTKRETTVQEHNRTFFKGFRANHLETSVHEESTSAEEEPAGESNRGSILSLGTTETVTATLTKGGHYDTVTETVQAKEVWWEDEVGYADFTSGMDKADAVGDYCYKIGFRNCSEEKVEELRTKVYDKMKSANVKTRYPFRTPFINRMVNEFGLFDGSVGFNGREERYSGGGVSDTGPFKADADYTKTTYQVIPNSPEGYFQGDDDMKFIQVKRVTSCHVRSGRGKDNMEDAFADLNSQQVVGDVQVSTGAGYSYSLSWETADEIAVSLVSGSNLM